MRGVWLAAQDKKGKGKVWVANLVKKGGWRENLETKPKA